ncbi:MAG: hypothetical protein LW875_02435 [Proteobacteria bacterium]|jgi:hypothetical protein|nr:hypothetical protein [Pseudomonadota bacterium]
MTCYGFCLFRSQAAGYFALNSLFRQGDHLKLIEHLDLGGDSAIIFQGDYDHVQRYLLNLRHGDLKRTSLVKDLSESLVKCYFSLEFNPPGKHLLIIESDFVGDLFVWSNEFVQLGALPVEFRFPKYSGSQGLVILTSDVTEPFQETYRKAKSERIKITAIQNIAPGLASFLDIQKS